MRAFRFHRPRTAAAAAQVAGENKTAVIKANGIDLLDRMKEGVDKPSDVIGLVDVEGLDTIGLGPDGEVVIGASVTLSEIAANDLIQKTLPILAESAGDAASPQLRHRATIAGNLCQHTRCGYYRLASFPCLKRGGEVCPSRQEGGVRDFAGIADNGVCASAHPSSIAPVLGALGAEIHVLAGDTERVVPFDDFWHAPTKGRASDTVLEPGDLITSVVIPTRPNKPLLGYAEIRQKAAYDWPLASAAVMIVLDNERKVWKAGVVLGSIAPTPWRAKSVEAALKGKAFDAAKAEEIAKLIAPEMTPLAGTEWRVKLATVALKRALEHAGKDA